MGRDREELEVFEQIWRFPSAYRNGYGDKNSNPAGNPLFTPGNKVAKAENISELANKKRMRSLIRTWEIRNVKHAKKVANIPVGKTKQAKKAWRTKRIKLYENVAREAREIQEKARKGAAAVMDRLVEIALSSAIEANAIAAADKVLDRAYGKSSQTNINATIDANGKPTEVTAKELDDRIAKVLKRVEDITGRAPKAPSRKERPLDLREYDRDPDSSTQH